MTNEQQKRVFIVHNSISVLQRLRSLMESVQIAVETYATPGEFLRTRDPSQSGSLVLDLRLPEMSGLELYRRLRQNKDPIPVIFFTSHGDIATAVTAMREGAFDFIEASVSEQRLLDRVNAALQKDCENRTRRSSHATAVARFHQLSPKEKTILHLLAAGSQKRDIARELAIAPKTVQFHQTNILAKMGVGNIAELTYLYLVAGLAETENHGGQSVPADHPQNRAAIPCRPARFRRDSRTGPHCRKEPLPEDLRPGRQFPPMP